MENAPFLHFYGSQSKIWWIFLSESKITRQMFPPRIFVYIAVIFRFVKCGRFWFDSPSMTDVDEETLIEWVEFKIQVDFSSHRLVKQRERQAAFLPFALRTLCDAHKCVQMMGFNYSRVTLSFMSSLPVDAAYHTMPCKEALLVGVNRLRITCVFILY
jgi:hypothetical protein